MVFSYLIMRTLLVFIGSNLNQKCLNAELFGILSKTLNVLC